MNLRYLPLTVLVLSFPAAARAQPPSVDPPAAPATQPLPPVYSAPPVDDTPVDQTLVGSHPHHGGYGAPVFKITSMTGDAAMLIGARGGWLIARHLEIGGAGFGLATMHRPLPEYQRANADSHIGFGYGGMRIGWIADPSRVVHLAAGVLAGGGGVSIVAHENGSDKEHWHDGSAFFVVEPEVEAELNVLKWLRVGAGASYRYVSDTNRNGLRSSDLSGPALGLALKFGSF